MPLIQGSTAQRKGGRDRRIRVTAARQHGGADFGRTPMLRHHHAMLAAQRRLTSRRAALKLSIIADSSDCVRMLTRYRRR